jgi:hypothetical protein
MEGPGIDVELYQLWGYKNAISANKYDLDTGRYADKQVNPHSNYFYQRLNKDEMPNLFYGLQ